MEVAISRSCGQWHLEVPVEAVYIDFEPEPSGCLVLPAAGSDCTTAISIAAYPFDIIVRGLGYIFIVYDARTSSLSEQAGKLSLYFDAKWVKALSSDSSPYLLSNGVDI